ncbi:NINE protein [Agrococcus baldri]|uniref:TM2 domain-containing protein n=1 Tax=Agrococcus baldri TaxID=153730 RepID=A0AA87RGX7_9MICO|nr:NINE protein [Agrococcus baldri]GEK80261.1 hypothetical protein ABA31_16120 [Agrococcus baldri]
MPTTPAEPGWYDDPDGRRRWWDGKHWGAYAAWAEPGEVARPEARPQRPTLDRSLTFDPTAGGRANRAKGEQPERPSGSLPRPAAGGASPAPIRGPGSPSPRADLRRPGTGAPTGGAPWAAADEQPRTGKQLATAYVLLVALGLLGAHRYYLGRLGSGIVQMMLSFAAAGAVVVLTDSTAPMWLLAVPAAAAIWWVSDLFRLPSIVRRAHR